MGWYSKEQATPYDALTIEGLNFRIGDQVARKYECEWYEGHKKPMLALPSSTLPLEYSHKQELLVALGGVALLPVFATSDEAIEQLGYFTAPFSLLKNSPSGVFEPFTVLKLFIIRLRMT